VPGADQQDTEPRYKLVHSDDGRGEVDLSLLVDDGEKLCHDVTTTMGCANRGSREVRR
jgi:hypothetical protein